MSRQGGAVALSSGDSSDDPGAHITMRNSTFVGNAAQLDGAGAIYLGEYAEAHFKGDHNNFPGHVCDIGGGALAATDNTHVTVEGGIFKDSQAGEVRG